MAAPGLLSGLTDAQIAGVRVACETSQHYFTRFMFKALEGHAFRVGQHHKLIDDTLDKVIVGEIPRLIVNEPPGFSKTLQCVQMFVARGFALNPRARFLHTSYSRDLVNQNSAAVQDVMKTPEYQWLWGRALRKDTTAKSLWRTPEGGSFKASPAGGALTGFRAGNMDELYDLDDDPDDEEVDEDLGAIGDEGDIFSGALIIDDPLKPDDAASDPKRDFVNARYMNTFRSRLAHERVPIIVVMQRIHPRDFSNHLLTGGGGDKFHHLMLPVIVDRSKGYPTEYSHGISVAHELPDGPLWSQKLNEDQIDVLKRDGKVYAAQYLQDPRATDHAVFSPAHFRHYEVRPRTMNVGIIVDPSGGRTKRSDRTAMAVIGVDANANKFLLDGFCHRMKLSERWDHLRRLHQRWDRATGVMNVTVGYEEYGLQADVEYIEERQEVENVRFPIKKIGWVREGSQSKEDRIQRLEPDFKESRFYLPATIYRAEEGGDCFWEGKPHGVELRRAYGKTSAQRRIAAAGEAWRVAETLIRRDENNQLYDLSYELMMELRDFPNAVHDDLSDAVSRIYDLDIVPAPKAEVEMVTGLNEQLVA
jgi:hypothetical protein